MSKQPHPHSRSVYPVPIVGLATALKIKTALRKAFKAEQSLDHNQCSLCPQDFRTVAKELSGAEGGVSGQVFLYNPASNTRCVLHSDGTVQPGTLLFWSTYEEAR